MNVMWMWNFLSFLKFTLVCYCSLTDVGIQFRNRLISDAIASLDL